MNLLPFTVYVSFAGALTAFAAGAQRASLARWIALVSACVTTGLSLCAAREFQPGPGLQTLVDVEWIQTLGIRYHLAVDGISLTLVVLTGLAAIAGILFSWNVETRTGEFFGFYLALIGGVNGVFLSADALLFFVFYEVAIVPKYFLIAIWGSRDREYGAMKLALYSFAGSALVLAGLLWLHGAGHATSYSLNDLAASTGGLSAGEQRAMFALIFLGFAVLAGLFPFHTWAPTGHVAAPTGASMLLAGVVMKLGAYGCLRVALPLFPAALAYWQPALGWLAVVGILYAGLIALAQDDLKFVIGYSSVSHMGFVLLGLAVANLRSVSGAVLQMFSHGIIAGLLFAVVGRMLYDRTHTRKLEELRWMPLHRLLPFATVIFVLAGLASMGMPGFSGFPAELSILLGAWKTAPVMSLAAAVGAIVAAAFILRAIQVAFFGRASAPPGETVSAQPLPPITFPEKAGALLLLGVAVLIGLKPDLLLGWIIPSLQSPVLQHALIGGIQ